MKNLINNVPVANLSLLLLLTVLPCLLGNSEPTTTTTTLTDPTRPPSIIYMPKNYAVAATAPLAVSAVFIYPHERVAIINEQVVKMGDHIGEFTITNINPYTVELLGRDNNKEVLQLAPVVKQASNTKGL